MRKAGTALLPFDGQLLAVAGRGEGAPTNPSPMAKYSKWIGLVYTNEHHIFNREKGEQPFLLVMAWCMHVWMLNQQLSTQHIDTVS